MYSEWVLVAQFPRNVSRIVPSKRLHVRREAAICYLLQSLLPRGGGYSLLSGEGRLGITDREMEKSPQLEKSRLSRGKLARDQSDENDIRISGDLS